MQAYAAKLIDLIESKSENIARQWADDVMKHNRTPSYHHMPKEMVVEQGTAFYKLFRRMALAANPYEEAKTFSWKYAEELYRKKIPLQEAIYALMLMRRNLWLYAEFQGTFVTVLEKTQAVESLNRTILLFDYVSYQVIEKYQDLIIGSVERRLGAVKTLMMKGQIAGRGKLFKTGLMIVLLIAACVLTYYNHVTLKTEGPFTHLFYIPVILASIWWGKKGIFVAVFIGILIVVSHLFFLAGVCISGDVIRAGMLVLIGGVVGWLMEGIKKVEEMYQ